MNIPKVHLSFTVRLLCVLSAALAITGVPCSVAQTTPNYPVSYRLFNPFIFNPAIAGSKDFLAVDLTISNTGKDNAQIASGDLRIARTRKEYFSALAAPEFTGIGLGAYFYNDVTEFNRNRGMALAGSYHVSLNREALSFLSFGVAAKGNFNKFKGDPDLGLPVSESFLPNIDAGIYFYSPSFHLGVSATNIMGTSSQPDSIASALEVSRQYFLTSGYKIVVSRSLDMVVEPLLIVNSGDSLPDKISEIFKPGLKLYAGNMCAGTYFNDFNRISFFLHFNYNKAHIGTYIELPYNAPYYKKHVTIEFSFGLNLSAIKSGNTRRSHW